MCCNIKLLFCCMYFVYTEATKRFKELFQFCFWIFDFRVTKAADNLTTVAISSNAEVTPLFLVPNRPLSSSIEPSVTARSRSLTVNKLIDFDFLLTEVLWYCHLTLTVYKQAVLDTTRKACRAKFSPELIFIWSLNGKHLHVLMVMWKYDLQEVRFPPMLKEIWNDIHMKCFAVK